MRDRGHRHVLTSADAAELLGVHPSTVKRWCDDGTIPSGLTQGGHRRITVEDALSAAAAKGKETYLDAFSPWQRNVWLAVKSVEEDGDFRRFLNLALGWLGRGEVELLGHLFHHLGQRPGVPFPRFLDEGVRGFMAAVGEGWRTGKLAVGEEHMASQVMVEVLIRLRSGWDRLPRSGPEGGENFPVAVVGGMESDLHDLGAQAVRTLLERMNWRVYFLGPNVPPQDFAEIQRAQAAELVCVSCSPNRNLQDVLRTVSTLADRYDAAFPYQLAFGGSLIGIGREDLPAGPFLSLDFFSSLEAFGDWLSTVAIKRDEAREGRAA